MSIRHAAREERHWTMSMMRPGVYERRWSRLFSAFLLFQQLFLIVGILDPLAGWAQGLWFATSLFVLVGLVLRRQFGPYGAMRRLSRDLPWLLAEPVVVHEVAGEPGLAEACARHGFHTVGIDGRALDHWGALAEALERALGPMRFPADPAAKCRALLQRAMGGDRRRTVLVVHDAVAMHPTLLAQLADGFRALAEVAPIGLRLVLDLPPAPAGPEPHREAVQYHGYGVPAPDRPARPGSRGDAWWHPKPGEFADR